jgi:hypothetical protein
MPPINSKAFKELHNINPSETLSLLDISKLSGFPVAALQEVYNRGVGAWKTNPESVRLTTGEKTNRRGSLDKMSKEQWGFGRVYSFVMKRRPTFKEADRDIAVKYNLLVRKKRTPKT